MLPNEFAKKGDEAGHQTALFAWANAARLYGFTRAWGWAEGEGLPDWDGITVVVPELKWMFHIPNGGSRGNGRDAMIRGAQLKAQGVKAGVCDIMLPVVRGKWAGLFIEMKKPDQRSVTGKGKGGVKSDQKEFGDFVSNQGYGYTVCYSWEEAARVVEGYLLWGKG